MFLLFYFNGQILFSCGITYAMLNFIHFEGFSKFYISFHHEFAPGMYNWCFCNDFVINSSQFDVYEDLTYGFLATGWNHIPIIHLIPRLTLCSALDPARDSTLGAHWSWQLVHWRPLMDESGIWVFSPFVPSN
jgi:hypothetical protein